MKSWLFVLPIGKTVVFWDAEGEKYAARLITEKHAGDLARETMRAISDWRSDAAPGLTEYLPPVIAEHVFTGQRYGAIHEARVAGIGPTRGLYLLVEWFGKTWEAIQDHTAQHVSIGTLPAYTDSKGRTYGPIIQELSLTGVPRLKDIGTIQDHLSLRLSDANLRRHKMPMTPEEMEAKLLELADGQAKMAEALAKLVEDKGDVEVELADGEMPEEEMEQMADKIATKLSDKVADKIATKLKGMRLGDGGAAGAPASKPTDPLARAKAEGKKGRSALSAAFAEMAK